jgi:glycosyltransferase involved in cell wall biosynthesis
MDELGIRGKCHLLGPRSDVNRVYCALDILTSSSVSEAFPLVVGEAMASGVPCVVTDVGDSKRIVGPTGLVVPPGDPAALATAWNEMLSTSHDARAQLGAAARQRVCQQFDLGAITRRYEALYAEVATPRVVKRGASSSSRRSAEAYPVKGCRAAAC